jgi:hypothetical protein
MTRIEEARSRAAGAKRIAVGAAGAGFLVALLLARAGHPGSASSSSSSTARSTSQQVQSQSESDDGLKLGTPSAAPSSGSSVVPTHVS